MAVAATWDNLGGSADDLVVRRDPEALVADYLATRSSDLKDMVILEFASTVERIARRYAIHEPVDDLVQVGYIGLLNALSKFDPNAGVRFTTYATHLVTGEIKHYLRDRAQTIRQPAWLQEVKHKIRKAATQLQATNGSLPTAHQIAHATGLPVSQVEDILAQQDVSKLVSLDAATMEDEDGDNELERLSAGILEPEQLDVEERMVLAEAIKKLRDLEQEVLVLFHFESLSQTEIAHRLGISCNYVSHILRQSLSKLRRILAEEERQDRILQAEFGQVESVVDPGTGVYDAAYFTNRLNEEVHRHSGNAPISVVMISFQGLSSLRAFFGAEGVEEFMHDAAGLIKGSVRALDIVCRSGDADFGVILPQTGENAVVVRDRFRSKLSSWVSTRVAGAVQIRYAVGCATAPGDARSAKELVAAATASAWAGEQAA